jgi:hypothetical protein
LIDVIWVDDIRPGIDYYLNFVPGGKVVQSVYNFYANFVRRRQKRIGVSAFGRNGSACWRFGVSEYRPYAERRKERRRLARSKKNKAHFAYADPRIRRHADPFLAMG